MLVGDCESSASGADNNQGVAVEDRHFGDIMAIGGTFT